MAELLTKDTFLEKIFDFENEAEWKFKGELPAIIDFYADWCAPCKMLSPVIDEISEEYKGVIDVFKLDTEKEREISAMFEIKSIPSILFIPKDGHPSMATGFMPKESFEKAISDIFDIDK